MRTFHTGFAPRDGIPRYPSLWKGLYAAYFPCLGPTGLSLKDWGPNGKDGTVTSITASNAWGIYGAATVGGSDLVTLPMPGAYAFAADGTGYVDMNLSALGGITKMSYMGWFRKSSTADALGFGGVDGGVFGGVNEADPKWCFNWRAGDTVARLYHGSDDVNNYSTYGISSANVWRSVVVIFDGTQSTNATKVVCYAETRKRSLTFNTNAPTFVPGSAFNTARIGQMSSDETAKGQYAAVAYWNRCLNENEAYALMTSPWAMLEMANDSIIHNPSSPPGVSSGLYVVGSGVGGTSCVIGA